MTVFSLKFRCWFHYPIIQNPNIKKFGIDSTADLTVTAELTISKKYQLIQGLIFFPQLYLKEHLYSIN